MKPEAIQERKDRHIALQGACNFRDIGGYVTEDGRRVKTGLLYRSDELCFCTSHDIEILESLGLKSIIDYRNEKERNGKEDVSIEGVSVYYLDPKADAAAMASSESLKEMPVEGGRKLTAAWAKEMMVEQNVQFVLAESSRQAYRRMFDLILDETKIPLVQHCRGGKDRTGYGVALVLLLLGVDQNTVLQDYMLTNVYKREKNERSLKQVLDETGDEDLVLALRYLKEANEEFLFTAINLIRERYGSVRRYVMRELSVTEQEIEKLRDMYLETKEGGYYE